ncbi:MAG: rod shape-determining protein MreD [Chloroflexi bacterium]|nr:rod shape-determining protein MreD [Chloroflexota bacterium]
MLATLFLIFPVAMIVVAVQSTVMQHITFLSGRPDLVLVSLVIWTAWAGREAALLPLLVMAPLSDALVGLPIGASVLPLLAVVYLAGFGERTLFGGQLGWPLIVSLVATLLAALILFLELTLLGWDIAWVPTLLRAILPSAFLNSLLTFVLYVPGAAWRQRRPTLM